MRTRAAYSPCKIYIDGCPKLAVGNYLRTPGGSAYLVQGMRQNKRSTYRRHLDCLRWPVDEIPADAVVFELHWYKRRRKKSVSLSSLAERSSP